MIILLNGLKEISDIFGYKIFFLVKILHLEIPPAHITADLSLSLFDLAKEFKQDPKKTGRRISGNYKQIKNDFIESAQAFDPYLNINFKKQKLFVAFERSV